MAIELSHRGHQITVQTTRPNWLGMPTYQMDWRPTNVTGINKASLAWLAGKIGYGEEWQAVQDWIVYERWFVPEEQDAAVATTKDMRFLRDMGLRINGYMTTYAVGYQHFPAVITVGDSAWTDKLLSVNPPPLMPEAFTETHPFGAAHGFGGLPLSDRVTPCGFPHLDKVRIDCGSRMNAVLIQHPGGHRGIDGHAWLANICKTLDFAGLRVYVCPHFIPGRGYDAGNLGTALASHGGLQAHMIRNWWEVAGDCDLILTAGSSAAYELWSVGLTNVFILGYVGGKRHEKFGLFQDLMIESPEALRKLLRGLPGSAQATGALTKDVMAAYRSLHTGQGAKTAADVMEGKR